MKNCLCREFEEKASACHLSGVWKTNGDMAQKGIDWAHSAARRLENGGCRSYSKSEEISWTAVA